MDVRPIGVFDSGLGGLTTVKKLAEYLPGEDIIYLGDTGRVPYGSRSKETIIKYALQDAAFLAGFNIKAMIVACNTVCSVAIGTLQDRYNLPLYEVVNAPSKAAVMQTKSGIVGVIGTAATIRSKAYETAILGIEPGMKVLSVPCPLFVPLAENGRTDVDDIAAMAIAGDYLSQFYGTGLDTLIMGCTHYPLLRGVIAKIMGPGVYLIDSGTEAAKLTSEDMKARNILSKKKAAGSVKYYVTDSAEGFSQHASRFLESDVRGMVEMVSLE